METTEMLVHGFLTYWKFFYLADVLSFAAMALFVFAAQIMIHKALPRKIALAVNFIVLLEVLAMFVAFYVIIMAKQQYGKYCRLNSAWPNGCSAPSPNYVAYALVGVSVLIVALVLAKGNAIRKQVVEKSENAIKRVSEISDEVKHLSPAA